MESKKPSTEKENPGLSGQDAHFEPFHVHGPGCNHGHHHHPSHDPYVRSAPKTGRNDPCPCGSGKKFKKCCGGVQP